MAVSTAPRPAASPIPSWEKVQRIRPSNRKSNPLLIVAVAAMVLLSLVGLWRAMHQPAKGEWVKVMAARADIPAGSRLGFAMISFLDVPKQFATPDMAVSLNDVAGRIARTYIPAGEPIRSYMVFSTKYGLSANLETHERAITLQLDDDALVDHSIMPDDRVDLLTVSSSKNGGKYTKTICQDVRVLITAPKEQTFAKSNSSGSAVNKITLAVLPANAELITEAAETGKIRLILRNRLCVAEAPLSGAKPNDLLPSSAISTEQLTPMPVTTNNISVPLPPPPPVDLPANQPSNPMWAVEVISGNHREVCTVPPK